MSDMRLSCRDATNQASEMQRSEELSRVTTRQTHIGHPNKKGKGSGPLPFPIDLRIPYRVVLANAAGLRLPPQLKTVSLIARRPNRIASREVGVQMSI